MEQSADEAIALARAARKEGRLATAREYFAAAARLYRQQNNSLAYAHAIRHVADLHREDGQTQEAKSLYEEALELYRGHLGTSILDLANTLRPYAVVCEALGDPSTARALWEEARQLYQSIRVQEGVLECDAHLALSGGPASPVR